MGESGVKIDVNALCLLARDLVGNEESGETFRNFSKALCSGMFMCSLFICIISFKVRCRWNKLNWTKKADIIVMRLAIWNGMRQCWHVSSAEIIPVITTFCHFFFKFVSFYKKTFQSCSLLLSFFSHNIDFSDQRSLVLPFIFLSSGGKGFGEFWLCRNKFTWSLQEAL